MPKVPKIAVKTAQSPLSLSHLFWGTLLDVEHIRIILQRDSMHYPMRFLSSILAVLPVLFGRKAFKR
jgi:hypothetical protein